MKIPKWLETILQAVKDSCLVSVARQDVTRAEYERNINEEK
jgi:hypothetical protein